MNPFDLRGPAFLLFYLVLAGAVYASVIIARRLAESGDTPRLPFVDPYLIACLRGGREEAVRVATLSLVDRGLVLQRGETLRAVAGAIAIVRRPLEQALLLRASDWTDAHKLPKDRRLRSACNTLVAELTELGLWASTAQYVIRLGTGGGALLVLWLVAGTKISIALARGHHNIAFLIVLAIAASVAVLARLLPLRTLRGDALLGELRTLFAGLEARASKLKAGGESNELALLTAIFGMSALEGTAKFNAQQLFPKAERSQSDGSGWGSSCSSGSSSSCGGGGSSCGGGGCGGCGS